MLPLRLSVSSKGLSIELTRPQVVGWFRVEQLEIALPDVRFPIDLSQGVRQFRSHRGQLSKLVVDLDLEQLAGRVRGLFARVIPDDQVTVRISAHPASDAVPADWGSSAGTEARNLGMVSVSVTGQRCALAFDVLLLPHGPPRLVFDAARGFGLSAPPSQLVLLVAQALREQINPGVSGLGRSVELGDLSRLLCVELLPAFGFRLPRPPENLGYSAQFKRGTLSLVLSSESRPDLVSPRALRLAGLIDLTRSAEEALARGELGAARQSYLEALEVAPGHPEILTSIAEIDAYAESRAASCLAFLEERRVRGSAITDLPAQLLRVRALSHSLRGELYVEALRAAADAEPDGSIRMHLLVELARYSGSASARRACLLEAISAAPSHQVPRLLLLEHDLEQGAADLAERGAEQLEALATSPSARAELLTRVGQSFVSRGFSREATRWLGRALRFLPDDVSLQIALGHALAQGGKNLQAAELFRAALAAVRSLLEARQQTSVASEELPVSEQELDRVRLRLAPLLADDAGDIPLAIATLREISSRSSFVSRARVLEATLAERAGDPAARRSAWLRLLEAMDLGWAELELGLLRQLEASEGARGNQDLADFAARLLQRISSDGPSAEENPAGLALPEGADERGAAKGHPTGS